MDVVVGAGTDRGAILMGNGDGTFRASLFSPAGAPGLGVMTGDFNGDGSIDLACGTSGGGDWHLLIYAGDGKGSFTRIAGSYLLSGAFAPGHFTSARTFDFFTVSYEGGHYSLLRGNGDGTIAAARDYPLDARADDSGRQPLHRLCVADFDGDGQQDVATSNRAAMSVSILHGRADGTFDPATKVELNGQPDSISAADIDGDGRPDLVIGFPSAAAPRVVVYRNLGGGTFAATNTFPGPIVSTAFSHDLDEDGRPDIVIVNFASLTIELNRGNGVFAESSLPMALDGLRAQASLVGDFDSDSHLDIVTLAASDIGVNGAIVFHQGRGDGSFRIAQIVSAPDAPRAGVAVDLNHDGILDLATNGFNKRLQIRLGTGDGTFTTATSYNTGGRFPSRITAADFNHDGNVDLASADPTFDAVAFLTGNGDGTFGAIPTYTTGMFPTDLKAADVNGDGRIDLLVTASGADSLTVLLNDSVSLRHRTAAH